MERRYRLRRSADFRRVRRQGRCERGALLVLCTLPNGLEWSRFGFAVGGHIGGAVVRNRIKRLLREAMRLRLGDIQSGWDVVFIARRGMAEANLHLVQEATWELLEEVGLVEEEG